MSKYSQKLIDKAHDLAFRGELSNKAIAKKLKITLNQLHYIIYEKHDSGAWSKEMEALKIPMKKEPTITESFLDFFIAEDFR